MRAAPFGTCGGGGTDLPLVPLSPPKLIRASAPVGRFSHATKAFRGLLGDDLSSGRGSAQYATQRERHSQSHHKLTARRALTPAVFRGVPENSEKIFFIGRSGPSSSAGEPSGGQAVGSADKASSERSFCRPALSSVTPWRKMPFSRRCGAASSPNLTKIRRVL